MTIDEDRDHIRELWQQYSEALEEEIDAASRAALYAQELENERIDVSAPPDWLK